MYWFIFELHFPVAWNIFFKPFFFFNKFYSIKIPKCNFNVLDFFMTKFLFATLRNRHVNVKVNTKPCHKETIKEPSIRDIEKYNKS